MATQGFEVHILGQPGGSSEDWRRAQSAPDSELPKLSPEQQDAARRMGIPAKEYARGVLVGSYAQERHQVRGQKLGQLVDQVLYELGTYYRLTDVIREAMKFRWLARVLTPKGAVNVAIPYEVADDAVDSGASEDLRRLRRTVLEGLNREDLLNEGLTT